MTFYTSEKYTKELPQNLKHCTCACDMMIMVNSDIENDMLYLRIQCSVNQFIMQSAVIGLWAQALGI